MFLFGFNKHTEFRFATDKRLKTHDMKTRGDKFVKPTGKSNVSFLSSVFATTVIENAVSRL